ncbi:very short patch repair endonuclease [Pseudomonas kitaguniensis]|uniref:very short patch repair endonuclease n=1 Tax=Pseudomonas kitaguniensis TaxID=2607908 RepID=UPI003B9E397E
MDVVDQATRSRMMSSIRGKNTQPELKVRRFLHAHGYRFRLHRKNLPGNPDIVLPKLMTCIFVHGCFWHKHKNCRYAATPKSRPAFWEEKLSKNVVRDAKAGVDLQHLGWRVLIIWECELRDAEATLNGLLAKLNRF